MWEGDQHPANRSAHPNALKDTSVVVFFFGFVVFSACSFFSTYVVFFLFGFVVFFFLSFQLIKL